MATSLRTLGFSTLALLACSDSTEPPPGGDGRGGGAPASGNASSSSVASSTIASTTSSGSGGEGTGAAGGQGGAGGTGGEGGKAEICEPYPVTLALPDTQAAAQAELTTFAPNASLTWAPTRGTLSVVTGLGVTLDCSSGDVWEAAWSVLEAHPDLFQLDRSEWPIEPAFPCSAVTTSTIVSTYRDELAGLGVNKDVLGIFVAPANGGVQLNAVSGYYLPVIDPSAIQDCPSLPDAELELIARAETYTYSTFNFCTPTGSGTYVPQPNDVITWEDTWYEWDDPQTGVVARKVRAGTLVIHESNWTPQLLASDLNCPAPMGDERVLGYRIHIDPVTGEAFAALPGIGCIVC